MRAGVDGYRMPDGRWLYLLAKGRLVNLAAGDGHPAEIMDMSFSLQALSAAHMALHGRTLENKVYDLPPALDTRVAELLLESKAMQIDHLTPEQEFYIGNWSI